MGFLNVHPLCTILIYMLLKTYVNYRTHGVYTDVHCTCSTLKIDFRVLYTYQLPYIHRKYRTKDISFSLWENNVLYIQLFVLLRYLSYLGIHILLSILLR